MDDLPPLPEPAVPYLTGPNDYPEFTSSQMRAYAAAAVAQSRFRATVFVFPSAEAARLGFVERSQRFHSVEEAQAYAADQLHARVVQHDNPGGPRRP